jgi:hypothetical protein
MMTASAPTSEICGSLYNAEQRIWRREKNGPRQLRLEHRRRYDWAAMAANPIRHGM